MIVKKINKASPEICIAILAVNSIADRHGAELRISKVGYHIFEGYFMGMDKYLEIIKQSLPLEFEVEIYREELIVTYIDNG